MSVKTAISQVSPGKILVRGYNLADMIGEYSYGDMVYLFMTGELPRAHEGDLLEAMLVSSVDHGLTAPSTHTARAVANCGVPVQAALAAGVTAIGEHHGGAGEACARILQEATREQPDAPLEELAAHIVAEARRQGKRLPGFGHRYHNPDPRAGKLLALADAWGISGRHVALARAIVAQLAEVTGRALPMNVDGAIAALISDMGIDWRYGKAVFILGRVAGMAAHVHEEMLTGKPFKFIAPVQAEYVGPAERPVPKRRPVAPSA